MMMNIFTTPNITHIIYWPTCAGVTGMSKNRAVVEINKTLASKLLQKRDERQN